MAPTAPAHQPIDLRLHVAAVARHEVPAHEHRCARTKIVADNGRPNDGSPQDEKDRGVSRRRKRQEPPHRVQGPVRVTGPRPHAVGLCPKLNRARLGVTKPEDLVRRLEPDDGLIVILAARYAGPMRGRADLDDKNRRVGIRRQVLHRRIVAASGIRGRLSHSAAERISQTSLNVGDLRRRPAGRSRHRRIGRTWTRESPHEP
jgi:hypothetical protein